MQVTGNRASGLPSTLPLEHNLPEHITPRRQPQRSMAGMYTAPYCMHGSNDNMAMFRGPEQNHSGEAKSKSQLDRRMLPTRARQRKNHSQIRRVFGTYPDG